MKLYNLFKEDWQTVRGYDKERYTEIPGLDGPISTKSGKVLYYDPKQGQYYDRDTDMYMDHDEALAFLNEDFETEFGFPLVEKDGKVATTGKTERILSLMKARYPQAENDIEALLLHFDSGQAKDRRDINRLSSENDAEEAEIEDLQKQLDKIKARRGMNEDYYETDEQRELARLGRILKDMGKNRDDDVGEAMGFLGTQLTRYGTPQGVNSIEKLEQVTGLPESTIMKMMALAQKVPGDVAVGDETAGNNDEVEEGYKKDYLTREKERIGRASDEYDVTPDNWEVKIDGKPWKVFRNKSSANQAASTIQMRYGKKTSVFATRKPVSEGVAKDFDKNFSKRIGYTVRGGAASDMMKKQAAQAQQQNRELDPGAAEKGLGIGVLDVAKARKKAKEKGVRAPGNLRASPNTRDPKRLPEAESQMVTATIPNNLRDSASKLERLAKENGVEYSRQGRTVTLTGDKTNVRRIFYKMAYDPANHPKMTPVNEAQDDIKIGDTVETKKMGQMQGVVTGFSTKTGDTRVMFKHKSGKVYATVPENLKVINSVNEGGFFDPDQPNPGDMVKHRNGAVGKVKKIETQDDETWVYFKDKNGEMNFGQWRKQVFPAKKTESLDDTVVEAKKKPVPTDPSKWSYYKSQAKKKFDVYPSAYANAWAAKQYKAAGGGWRMGKPKK